MCLLLEQRSSRRQLQEVDAGNKLEAFELTLHLKIALHPDACTSWVCANLVLGPRRRLFPLLGQAWVHHLRTASVSRACPCQALHKALQAANACLGEGGVVQTNFAPFNHLGILISPQSCK